MTDKELFTQALEALEFHVKNADEIEEIDLVLVTALRERLAHCDRCGKKLGGPDHIHTCSPQQPMFHLRSHGDVSAEELERLAQPVQEPIAWRFRFPHGTRWHYTEHGPNEYTRPQLTWEPLYTAPQPRQWQGLTVAQIEEAFQQSAGADEDTHIRFARVIEAKLKEKNT